jgi:hypothetical protein
VGLHRLMDDTRLGRTAAAMIKRDLGREKFSTDWEGRSL